MTTIERAAKYLGQSGVPGRCKGCGGWVYFPCKCCKLRARLASGVPIEDEPVISDAQRRRDAERKRAQVERRRLGMAAAAHPNS